ncbi:MAG: N-acyl homoserine lactonase family protein [Chloroflexi bacterium]|nr:N-acyl homoserine lactonase family protein [Chloroflexota bacterium]
MSDYKIYAVWYGKRSTVSSEVFYGDFHDAPVDLAYFVWVIRNGDRTVLVDLGFTREVARKREREIARPIEEGLKLVDVDPASVRDVIVTHFHYDHVGNYALFPNATFHVQDEEMRVFTGRYLRFRPYKQLVEIDDICSMVRLNYDGRVRFVDGEKQLFPGISVHKVGGHAPGIQVVRVATRAGNAVIASDALHFYRNLDEHIPFYLTHDLGKVHDAFDRVQELADKPELIFAGHDPGVLDRFDKVGDKVVSLG